MKMAIMRGPSGSGKTSYATLKYNAHSVICSADQFFMLKGEGYKFDPRLLPEAHSYSMTKAINATRDKIPFVVIDNTNCSSWEVAPYVALAKAMNYELIFEVSAVQTLDQVVDCFQRNTHGLDLATVARQAANLKQSLRDEQVDGRYQEAIRLEVPFCG